MGSAVRNLGVARHCPQSWQFVVALVGFALFLAGCIAQPQGVIINTKPTPTPTPIVGDPNNATIIEVTLADNTVPPDGVGIVWVNRSEGWAPYESPGDGRLPPDEYSIQIFIDDKRIGVVWPDETGGLGPRPLAVPQNVWGFELGQHTLKFVQQGPEVWRESTPIIIVVTENFKPTPTVPPTPTPKPVPTPSPRPS